MKGFVPTPTPIVDLMVEKLFRDRPPRAGSTVLDPGCGLGAFVDGVIRWCRVHQSSEPRIVGIDSDPTHVAFARRRFAAHSNVEIRQQDFLVPISERFDYVIGNPPYVPIDGLDLAERENYRRDYATAVGRFDLYMLFFEQSVSLLRPGARLVFITPEKFLYVGTADPLRKLLASRHVAELHFLSEQTFADLVTYPLVTTVDNSAPQRTSVISRDGAPISVRLDPSGRSWQPIINGVTSQPSLHTLADACMRISCGVATGADAVFTVRTSELDECLAQFAHPTISGREIAPDRPLESVKSLLVPYTSSGDLIAEKDLRCLGEYLSSPEGRQRLMRRTCVHYKPWYAFHETPPLRDLLRPKVLCKDIGRDPFFLVDREGTLVPRHSVYYIVPKDPSRIDALTAYLNSAPARRWLRDHCQRAANGFIRLQSHVLKRLPLPADLRVADHVVSQNLDAPQPFL